MSDISSKQFCRIHSNIELEYFCSEHDSVLCLACLVEGHWHCKLLPASYTIRAKTTLAHVENVKKETEHILEIVAALSTDIQTYISALGIPCKTIERTESLQLLNITDENKQEMQRQLTKINYINKFLQEHAQTILFIEKYGTERQAFFLSQRHRKILTRTEIMISQIAVNCKRIAPQFDFSLENSIFRASRIKHNSLKPAENHQERFQIYIRFDTICTNVCGMVATDDGKVLLCEFSDEHGVMVYSQNGLYIKTVTLSDRPFDIAFVHRSNKYVVTLPYSKSIQFISSDLEPSRIIDLQCRFKVYGIAATHQCIFVGECQTIFILDINGVKMKDLRMTEVTGSILYISRQINNRIFAADQWGDVFCIAKDGGEIEKIKTPTKSLVRNTVVDNNGCIYCIDKNSSNIYRFSTDMEQDMTVRNPSLNDVSVICLSKSCLKLFLATESGSSIVIMNLN